MVTFKPLQDSVIVEPYYDADLVGSGHNKGAPTLVLPDSAKNPMAQQGSVVAVGKKQMDIRVGDYILFHPFVARPLRLEGKEYLHVEHRHIAAWLSPSDGECFPLPEDVLLRPHFKARGAHKAGNEGLIYAYTTEPDPPTTGVILRVGNRVRTLKVGNVVVIPYSTRGEGYQPIGHEIGIINQVLYTIPERDIPAIVETVDGNGTGREGSQAATS